MSRRRYKKGIDRQQASLLPPRVDDYVAEDNPVRAIDAYVESLDLEGLGFQNTAGDESAGQPAFPPKALLKLYLYGYLHHTRSSRRLERECQRNLEVIWLVEGLRPGYKTIADFRKNNLEALRGVNRDFVQLCKELDLFGRELVAIDGSFFRGNVSKRSIYTAERLKKALERIDQHIAEYLEEMEAADREEGQVEGETGEKAQEFAAKLAQLKERQQKHQERLKKLQSSGETQLAEVDEEARLLKKGGQSVAGYNVQTVVDQKNKLIVACEVCQDGNDENQLEPMAGKAKEILATDTLTVVADAGYYNAQQIIRCQEAQIVSYVPEPDRTKQAKMQGRFPRERFTFDAQANCYYCPAGQALPFSSRQPKDGKTLLHYRSSVPVCAQCLLRGECLPTRNRYRTVTRWEHEAALDQHRQRMTSLGHEMMHQRACLAEHPFGTLKCWCGWTHFLLRGLRKVRAEMNLLMLCYNFKRLLSILGLQVFRAYCSQRALIQT